jgi:peptidylprolyl isomerase
MIAFRHALPVAAVLAFVLTACEDTAPPPATPPPPMPTVAQKPVAAADEPRDSKSLPAPPDVAAPPANATTTASGLAYVLLSHGGDPSARKPGPTSTVKVHYTGWTTDGKMFDSSVTRGEPATFPLNHVIRGWTEGLQLMAVGDKMRFWIPATLAYGDPTHAKRAGAPEGMLVFDVELLDVEAGQ